MANVFATNEECLHATVRLQGITSRAGTIWSSQEQELLTDRFHQGMSLYDIAHKHQRNPNNIIARLKGLQLIEWEPHNGRWVDKLGPSLTNPWANNPYVSTGQTTITLKESNIMTKPLEHKAFLFGSDITTLSSEAIVNYIKRANDEINSYASIPENNYTKLRIANLKDAIEAAVKELNKRGE